MPLINFSGLASGIDTNSLIDATSKATRAQRVTPKQKKIDELTTTNKALTELETKLTGLKTSAETIGTIAGGAVAKTATSSNETVASATVTNGALNGSYDLSVTSIAKADSYSFGYGYSGSNDTVANLAASDTITFTIGTSSPESVPVLVTPTMTVGQFITQFNSQSSRAEASLVQVDSTHYRILISSTETGTSHGSISASQGGGFTFIPDRLDTGTATNNAATDATFSINGIGPFTRSTNNVNDVISGVTFNLLSTPGTATIGVATDPSTSAATLKKFVDAYNEVVKYISDNDTITQDQSSSSGASIYGTLANTRTDNSAMSVLREALAGISVSSSSTIAIPADLGITTERDGTLKFDEKIFTTALGTDPTSVNNITMRLGDKFGYQYKDATGDGIIDSLTRFNGLFDTSTNANKTLIDSLNKQITDAEAAISKTEEDLRARFARLESTISKLQSQQSSLTASLAGLK